MSLQSPDFRNFFSLITLFFCVMATSACAHRGDAGSSDLAVDRVVLYQSGVAYVERSGMVSGDELVLRLRPDQINDVLSSLVVIDLDEGSPITVSLPARASEETSPLGPGGDAQGMTAFLRSLRGADVRIRHDEQRTRGRVLGLDDSTAQLSLLVNGREARFISLADIKEVELENEAVAMRVRQSLDESMSADDWQSVEVTLRFPSSNRKRNLMVAWVVEMPLWKPSYRVMIEEDDQMHLQGWAVVDNLSGEDWKDIQLSLASGTPLSFRFDLHSPIHIERPDLSGYGVPQSVDLRPPTPMRAIPTPQPAPRERQSRARPAPSAPPQMDRDQDFNAPMLDAEVGGGISAEDRTTSAGQGAEVEQLDSLFRFDLPNRVTLPDRSSTLVTLVNGPVGGQDMLVFQPGSGASQNNPYRSLLLHNTTDAPVQRSPVAIYRQGTFVGEGITPHIAPNERAVLPYALESRVHLTRNQSTRSGDVELVRIYDGRLQVEREEYQIWSFDITSSLDDDQTIFVEVPRHGGFELQVDDDLDIRREENFYLVPVDLPAGEEHTQEIVQMRKTPQQLEVYHTQARDLLVAALDRSDLRPDLAEKLRSVTGALDDLASIERALADERSLREDIQQRTGELRANIATLGDAERNEELRTRLMNRLEEQDELMATLAARIVENSEKRSALRIEIQEMMRELRSEYLITN